MTSPTQPPQEPRDLLERMLGGIGLRPHQYRTAKLLVVLVLVAASFLLVENLGSSDPHPKGAATAVSTTGVTERNEQGTAGAAEAGQPRDDLGRYQQAIALKLQQALSHVAGAGQVEVTVTLAAGPTMKVYEETKTNNQQTNTKEASGATQTTTTTDTSTSMTVLKSGGSDQPVVLSELAPDIAGVLVVADGASSQAVRLELTRAASVALGISPSRITVLPRGASGGIGQ